MLLPFPVSLGIILRHGDCLTALVVWPRNGDQKATWLRSRPSCCYMMYAFEYQVDTLCSYEVFLTPLTIGHVPSSCAPVVETIKQGLSSQPLPLPKEERVGSWDRAMSFSVSKSKPANVQIYDLLGEGSCEKDLYSGRQKNYDKTPTSARTCSAFIHSLASWHDPTPLAPVKKAAPILGRKGAQCNLISVWIKVAQHAEVWSV